MLLFLRLRMRLLHPLLLPPPLLINPLRGNNNSLANYNYSSSLGINTMPQYHQQPRLTSLQNMDPQIVILTLALPPFRLLVTLPRPLDTRAVVGPFIYPTLVLTVPLHPPGFHV